MAVYESMKELNLNISIKEEIISWKPHQSLSDMFESIVNVFNESNLNGLEIKEKDNYFSFFNFFPGYYLYKIYEI